MLVGGAQIGSIAAFDKIEYDGPYVIDMKKSPPLLFLPVVGLKC